MSAETMSGRRWSRVVLMGAAAGALGLGAVCVFGPESWQRALYRVWVLTLAPRRAVPFEPDPQPVEGDSSTEARTVNAAHVPGVVALGEPADAVGGGELVDVTSGQAEPESLTDSATEEPRPLVRRMPQDNAPESAEAETLSPLTLTGAEDEPVPESGVPVPIVDKPPRKLPPTRAEELPAAGRPAKPLPSKEVSKEKALPEAEAPAVSRPGLRRSLSSIEAIETRAARMQPLKEREQIDKAIQLEDLPTALRELSRWYWRTPEVRPDLHAQLIELADQVYFSPLPHFHEPYTVQPGDRLQSIARKYHVPWEYLCRVNKVNAKKIRAGQRLKVVDGPFSAFVSLSNYELIVHHRGSFVRWYPVGVGKAGSTPEGTFTVKEKLVDPTYYGDDGVLAHDDPKNPLGERWIDIGNSFGIHGTIDPASIGRNESRGCIRLLNEDVEELYDLLSVGSEVTIQK